MTIYLDHNATTPVRPEVIDAMNQSLGGVGNPSSVHGAGRAARKMIEDAREQVAALVGARARDVVFTSGGTEANNLALSTLAEDAIVFVSAVEHPSVLAVRDRVEMIPVTREGAVDLEWLEKRLSEISGPKAVSVMAANNETGVLQPIADMVRLAGEQTAWVHCDAVQAAGKIGLDVGTLGVTSLSLSAHKIGGPPGIGALVLTPGSDVGALIRGGGQERGRRAGTENLPGIVGFGAAAAASKAALPDVGRLATWRDAMEAELKGIAPELRVFGAEAERLPNTSCLTMPGVDSETQVMNLDLDGFCVSAGSACSSGKVEPSHVLEAMGVEGDDLNWALRVSLGWSTKENEIQDFTLAWKRLYARLGHGAIAA